MEVVIQKACKTDIPILLDIQKKAFTVQANLYDAFDMPPMVETSEQVLINDESCVVLVAKVEGAIIGSIRVAFSNQEAEIKRLSVDPNYQKRGVADKLMKAAESYCQHIQRIWLFTGGQSHDNIAFYKNRGYKPYKEIPYKSNFTLIYLEKLKK